MNGNESIPAVADPIWQNPNDVKLSHTLVSCQIFSKNIRVVNFSIHVFCSFSSCMRVHNIWNIPNTARNKTKLKKKKKKKKKITSKSSHEFM